MNWIGIITTFLTVVNILTCVLLIFVVLLQRPKNEGLGAAFGGDTASNIFGAQTTNVLANVTRWLGAIFLGLCLVIAILGTIDPTRKSAINSYIEQKQAEKKADVEKKKAEEAAKAAEAELKAKKPDGAPIEKPAATTPPIEAPKPAPVTPAPATPKPEATPTPAAEKTPEPAKPAEKAPEAAKPVDAPKPADEAKPAEAPKPTETPASPVPASPAPEAPKAQ